MDLTMTGTKFPLETEMDYSSDSDEEGGKKKVNVHSSMDSFGANDSRSEHSRAGRPAGL